MTPLALQIAKLNRAQKEQILAVLALPPLNFEDGIPDTLTAADMGVFFMALSDTLGSDGWLSGTIEDSSSDDDGQPGLDAPTKTAYQSFLEAMLTAFTTFSETLDTDFAAITGEETE